MTFLLFAVAFASSPRSPGESFSEAAAEYRAGLELRDDSARARPHFLRAAEAFEQLWNDGTRTAMVARNMAQARFLAGDIGRSIRDYRRGLKVEPHNPELLRNLDRVRDQVAHPLTGDVSHAARPRERTSPIERIGLPRLWLAAVALGTWALGWFVLARAWLAVRGGLAIVAGLMVVGGAILGGGLVWDSNRAQAHWSAPTAVVVSPVEIRTGNNDNYPRRLDGRLPAGVELHIVGERGGWLHIELADGSAGWVPSESVAMVD